MAQREDLGDEVDEVARVGVVHVGAQLGKVGLRINTAAHGEGPQQHQTALVVNGLDLQINLVAYVVRSVTHVKINFFFNALLELRDKYFEIDRICCSPWCNAIINQDDGHSTLNIGCDALRTHRHAVAGHLMKDFELHQLTTFGRAYDID